METNFWHNKKDYPEQWLDPRRFFCDIGKLIPLTSILNAKRIRDISCGLGYHGQALMNAVSIDEFNFYDYNQVYVDSLNKAHLDKLNVKAHHLDIGNVTNFKEQSDFDYCLGSLHYIINDSDLENFFKLTADTFLIRVPISMDTRIDINKYSDELKFNYAATYRTLKEYLNLLRKHYKHVEWSLAFPESFDSKFGTRQFYILCQKTKNTSLESLVEWAHWLV